MTTVYLVRHASPNFNNHDDLTRELTQQGLEDRKLVTKFLWDKNIHAVLSSPYRRAVDTVKEFADKKEMEIHLVEDFRERRIGNDWIEDFDGFSRKQWEDFDFKLSDGESLREVQGRNISALYRVLERYQGENVVIGSHGTALSTIIQYFVPAFGYDDFNRIKKLMPWIVIFSFESISGGRDDCAAIRSIDLFRKEEKILIESGRGSSFCKMRGKFQDYTADRRLDCPKMCQELRMLKM